MPTLGAGFDSFQPIGDRIVDSLVVADLEMQEAMIFDAAPITTKKRIAAYEVQCACDRAALAPGHDQQRSAGHGIAYVAEKRSG